MLHRSLATPVGITRSAATTLLLALLLAGCTVEPQPATCPSGTPMRMYELYFGRSVPGNKEVTDRDWSGFTDQIITANLPNGYTVLDATGAWMNPKTQRTIREATKMLQAALPDTPDSLAAIARIRSAYQTQFQQQLVGMTTHTVCASF